MPVEVVNRLVGSRGNPKSSSQSRGSESQVRLSESSSRIEAVDEESNTALYAVVSGMTSLANADW